MVGVADARRPDQAQGLRGAEGIRRKRRRRSDARELQDHVKAKLAPYKYPRWIEFRAELPKTATGKIQRFKLRGEGVGALMLVFSAAIRRVTIMKRYCLPAARSQLSPRRAAPSMAQQKPIKIGFISSFSGPVAAIGNDMRNSFELALDHLGRKVGGMPVE